MKRALLCLVIIPLLSVLALGQSVPVTTYSITELSAKVSAASLEKGLRTSLTSKLSDAQDNYLRGHTKGCIGKLGDFINQVEAQSEKGIQPATVATWTTFANNIISALKNGQQLGGTEVSSAGATLEIADTNSPAFGTKLVIPPNALAGSKFISMTIPENKPQNSLLQFPGSGIAFGPEGLEFQAPATLVLPYPDADGDGTVDGTSLKSEFLKVGAQNLLGRISFIPRTLDTTAKTQTAEIHHFSFYWNLGWYWGSGGGTLTYRFDWPSGGIPIAPGYDLNALKEGARQAVGVWAQAMAQAGFSFQEVPSGQPSSFRLTFFSPSTPMLVSGWWYRLDALAGPVPSPTSGGGLPPMPGPVGDGAALVFAHSSFDAAQTFLEISFNLDFGRNLGGTPLWWTANSDGSPDSISIEAVAVHAIGHVLGLNDFGHFQPPVMGYLAHLINPEICLFVPDVDTLRSLYGISPSTLFPACPHAGIVVSPSSYSFGPVLLGSSAQTSFTIRNSGSGTLIFPPSPFGIAGSGPFFDYDSTQTSQTLRPSHTTTLKATFNPAAIGASWANLSIASNAQTSPTIIALSGTGAVPPVAPTCTLTASPSTISQGGSSTLSWTTTGNPTSASIDNGVGTVNPAGGSTNVMPSASTTYTLGVSNTAGSDTCSAMVTVTGPPQPPGDVRGGPPGANVTALAIDRSNPATLYAIASGRIFKSANGGGLWVPADSGLPVGFIASIAIDPGNSLNLYASSYSGVFKSVNGGSSWMTLAAQGFVDLVMSPTSPTTLYGANETQGVLKSTDGGTSWFAVNNGLTNLQARQLVLDPTNPNMLYVATFRGIFRTDDGALTWTAANPNPMYTWGGILAIDPVTSSTIYSVLGGSSVYKSLNRGLTWALSSVLTDDVYFTSLTVDSTNPTVLYAGTAYDSVYRSSDGGLSWARASTGLIFTQVHAIESSGPGVVYAGSNGGVSKSIDGAATWFDINVGLSSTFDHYSGLAVDQFSAVYATTSGGLFKSVNGGANWILKRPNAYMLGLAPTSPAILYTVDSKGWATISKSIDGGNNWSAGSRIPQYMANTVSSVAVVPSMPETIYVGTYGSGAFKSVDGGISWIGFNPGPTNSGYVFCWAIDPTNSDIVYAATNGPAAFADLGVFKSTDGALSWSRVSGLPAGLSNSIVIAPSNPSVVYTSVGRIEATVYRYTVFKSSDGGASWTDLGASNITLLAIDPNSSSVIYAGAATGLVKSADGGVSWNAASAGLPDGGVSHLAINPANPSVLYAGTNLAGVFKSSNGGVTWLPTGTELIP